MLKRKPEGGYHYLNDGDAKVYDRACAGEFTKEQASALVKNLLERMADHSRHLHAMAPR